MHFSVQSAVLLVLLFEKKPMCFSRPTKDLVYTLHLTIRGSILSTYIFQNHDVILDDESHFKINKKKKRIRIYKHYLISNFDTRAFKIVKIMTSLDFKNGYYYHHHHTWCFKKCHFISYRTTSVQEDLDSIF